MRICIVAEHASKKFGGEAVLPVHYFRLLRSLGVESWMVVHARTQNELTELFPDDIDRILFVPDLWIHKLFNYLSGYLPRRLSMSTLGLLSQVITQFCQKEIVRRLIRDKQINLIHQPIPVAPKYPSVLYGLGVPVVIGPLNGGMQYPPAFRSAEPWIARAGVAIAARFVNLVHGLLPGKRRADVVLVANERTRLALPSGIRGRVIELVENGIDFSVWQGSSVSVESSTARFVFLGRLVDLKSVDVVIRALKAVPLAELEVIGDGPMREPWQKLADELGVKERVHFTGWLPQEQCAARLQTALALVLPSIIECGGAVVLESMAMGKPVIATRWGGPVDYLDESSGILVAPTSYQDMVDGFAEAMGKLIASPELAQSMGIAGRKRALRDFDWQHKIDQMIGIYRSLLEKSDVSMTLEDHPASPAALSEHR
ncbi:glycosyltransferase family 4 protein [Acidicapsa acidisoli]|uniref:glycosyltransferase family 4 protein n=1 Tax=Acidicapsa acidisoli TaxID=1615681 RepID=UPI0021DFFDEE|nr:glycosyltransferase family 4 protein [Acidicapsa acidisoli]